MIHVRKFNSAEVICRKPNIHKRGLYSIHIVKTL